MLRKLSVAAVLTLPAAPALAAGEVFFSLANTDFVVLLAFLLFVGILLYMGVPKQLTSMLDKRAEGIRAELDQARALREEAHALLAEYERKQRDVQEQADRIVSKAREEAKASATNAKADIAASVERRLAAAEEQIRSAEAAAVREVRNQAASVAVSAARQVIAEKMSADRANALIDSSIETVGAKLH